MAEFTLTATPVLGGYDRNFGAVQLTERTGLAIVSMAVPLGGDDGASAAARTAWGVELPAPGASSLSGDGATRLICSCAGQYLVLFDHPGDGAEAVVASTMDGAVYTTDQSDVWVALQLRGRGARAALERLCPIDLHPASFPPGAAARTVMEHMGAFVLCEAEDSFLLLSASSSAASFLHALETSIAYTS